MKKIILAMLLSTFCAGAAADKHRTPVTTVEKAKTMPDDSRVVLEGRITGRAGDDDDEYWFSDGTGRVRINIDDDDDESRLVGKKVRIRGDVDRDHNRVEIDVDNLRTIR